MFEDEFPFPKVGYVSFREGNPLNLRLIINPFDLFLIYSITLTS